jgi:hypothetical protein
MFSLDISTKEQPVGFNSAHYFSVANRLARYFPDLSESKFIQSYVSLLPPGHAAKARWLRPLYLLIQQVDTAHTSRTKTLPRNAAYVAAAYPNIFGEDSFYLLCHYVLSNYLQTSFFMQDAVMQFIVTSLLFFLLLLHVQLYNALPALVLLPFALVVGTITLYVLMRVTRIVARYINEWNKKRIAPFSEKIVKVAEVDEFAAAVQEANLDETDMFEDFGAPPPPMDGPSSPIKVTYKAQPKHGMPNGASKAHNNNPHAVHPFTEQDAQGSPSRSRPQVKSDSSSSGSLSDEEKSDSSDDSTDSETFRAPSTYVSNNNANAATKRIASNNSSPVRADAKLRARTKLNVVAGFSTPARSTQAQAQSKGAYTPSPARSEKPRDSMSRAERLMSLGNDDHRSTSLYNVKSSFPK